MQINISLENAPTQNQDYATRWEGEDQGLICSWLRGGEMALENPSLAARALAGELPPLPWKGGVEKRLKLKNKIGAFHYVAAWQGLRGESLAIDTNVELTMVCSRTGVPVTFTYNLEKLLQEGA